MIRGVLRIAVALVAFLSFHFRVKTNSSRVCKDGLTKIYSMK